MYSRVESSEYNGAMLYINGHQVQESQHWLYSGSGGGQVRSTSGREVNLEVSQGDKIKLRAHVMDGYYEHINYCVEYVP